MALRKKQDLAANPQQTMQALWDAFSAGVQNVPVAMQDNPELSGQWLQSAKDMMTNTVNPKVPQITALIDQQLLALNSGQQAQQNVTETPQDAVNSANEAPGMIPQPVLQQAAQRSAINMNNKKSFNLKRTKRAQAVDQMGGQPFDAFDVPESGQDTEMIADPMDSELDFGAELEPGNEKFEAPSEIVEFITSQPDAEAARDSLLGKVNPAHGDSVVDIVKTIFENPQDRAGNEALAITVWEYLNPESKNESGDMESTITAPRESVEPMIKKIESDIRNLAIKHAQSSTQTKQSGKQGFNLKKHAQHHTDNNVIMWGPGEKRYDPFYHQPVSDWHIVERNKGFGQNIDDVWNLDWEAFWRGNIMDKYSRPYRDSKTGEWVGGYIQKRFEVDKNIPETNNMQIKPGQLRRPILPEYGNTESRLQAMRSKNDKEYDFQNTSEPTKWIDATTTSTFKKVASDVKKKLI